MAYVNDKTKELSASPAHDNNFVANELKLPKLKKINLDD